MTATSNANFVQFNGSKFADVAEVHVAGCVSQQQHSVITVEHTVVTVEKACLNCGCALPFSVHCLWGSMITA